MVIHNQMYRRVVENQQQRRQRIIKGMCHPYYTKRTFSCSEHTYTIGYR